MTDRQQNTPSVGGRGLPPPPEDGFDALLDRLETQVARLADGSAPLDQMVEAHDEAQRLIDEASRRLRDLMARLDAEHTQEEEPEQPA